MSAPATASSSPRPGLSSPRTRKARRHLVRTGAVVDIVQDGPSMAGRIAWLGARLMIRPTLSGGSYLPSAPWPWGVVECAARAITPGAGALSVPSSWAAAIPPIRQVAVTWPSTLPGATPAVLAASPENLVNEMLLASMAVRGIGGAAPKGPPASTIRWSPGPPDRRQLGLIPRWL